MEEQLVWKDRKRFLGLPLSFTRYSIKNNRLYLTTGFFNVEVNELMLYRILDQKVRLTLGDRMVGVGTITLYTCDETNKELSLVRIKKPRKVAETISQLVEAERQRLKIAGREIYGVADSEAEADKEIFD